MHSFPLWLPHRLILSFPLEQLALRQRQVRALVLSLVASHAFLSVSLAQPLALLHPIAILGSFLSFSLGVLPLVVARKRELSSASRLPSSAAKTRAEQLAAILQYPSSWFTIGLHSAAFAALSALHCLTITFLHGLKAEWSLQVWVSSHGAYYINERFLFIVGQSAVAGAVYCLLFRIWPSSSLNSFSPFRQGIAANDANSLRDRVSVTFFKRAPLAAFVGVSLGASLLIVYLVIRQSLWSIVLAIVGHRGIVRRILVPSFRPRFGYFHVLLRSAFFDAAALTAVDTAYILVDAYLSQSLSPVSKLTKDPNGILYSGTSDESLFFSHHAFSELHRIAAMDSQARITIFKDIQSDRSAWLELSSACLKIVEQERTNMACKGIASTIRTSQTPVSDPAKSAQAQETGSDSVWDALARGQQAQKTDVHTVSAGRQPAPPANAISSATRRKTIVGALFATVGAVWRNAPADARHALCPPSWRFYLFESCPALQALTVGGRDSARLLWAILSLKDLLQHSLDEDPFGSVQRDIRKVMRSLLGLGQELKSLRQDLWKQAAVLDDKLEREIKSARSTNESERSDETQMSKGQVSRELSQAWTQSGTSLVETALVASIKGIAGTFKSYKLQLDPELEAQLSAFLQEPEVNDFGAHI